MRELYACQLLLTDREASLGDTLNRAERLIREWVGRPTHLATELLSEGQHEASGGHTVAISRYKPAEDGSSAMDPKSGSRIPGGRRLCDCTDWPPTKKSQLPATTTELPVLRAGNRSYSPARIQGI